MAAQREVGTMDAGQLTERMLARENVANVRKHWVRLVTACNSRCVFCLDTDTPRNMYLLEPDVRQELRRGREELNADKVILSGENARAGSGGAHVLSVERTPRSAERSSWQYRHVGRWEPKDVRSAESKSPLELGPHGQADSM
jgi:2-iminoacetate synthase ThiH